MHKFYSRIVTRGSLETGKSLKPIYNKPKQKLASAMRTFRPLFSCNFHSTRLSKLIFNFISKFFKIAVKPSVTEHEKYIIEVVGEEKKV